jgi:flagellar biosynthesis protein FlhG
MAPGSVWTLAGGKGGAGRTLLAANLGIQLARAGRRVLLVDLDLQCGQLHAALGFARVKRGLLGLLSGNETLADTAIETSIPNLRLVGGLSSARPPREPQALVAQVRAGLPTLDAEVVIVDCGSGRGDEVLDAFSLGTLGIVASTAEPQALEAAVLFAEAHLRRCLDRALPDDTRRAIDDLLAADGLSAARLPFRDLMIRIAALDGRVRGAVAREAGALRLELILNLVRDEGDEEAGAVLASAFRKGLGLPLPIAGLVPHDPSVAQAVAKRRPLSQQFPNTPATRGIARAAERLLAAAAPDARGELLEWEEMAALDHYRVLEVHPKASPKEIQGAYHVLRRALDPDTTPLAPLVAAEALRGTLDRIEDAYRTLIFLESRIAYDRQRVEIGCTSADQVRGLHDAVGAAHPALPAIQAPAAMGEGTPPSTGSVTAAPGTVVAAAAAGVAEARSSPEPHPVDGTSDPATGPEIPAGVVATAGAEPAAEPAPPAEQEVSVAPPQPVPLTGAGLAAERVRLGLTLEGIASRTKIRVAYLKAIEEERFDRLPPPVFLRGFIRELAACLGLPSDDAARALLARRERQMPQEAAPPAAGGGRKTA